jgi:hypothetical protein
MVTHTDFTPESGSLKSAMEISEQNECTNECTRWTREVLCFTRAFRSRRRRLSILRLQSRFIFGNKRTNLLGHVQKFQPLLLI